MRATKNGGRSSDSQHGQVLLIVAISMFVLIGFVGLAVDVGFWYGQRRHMQNAADAGALAGAYEICQSSATSDEPIRDAAIDYAARNGADVERVQVRITDPTGTDTVSVIPAVRNTVIVTATVQAQTFFGRILGITSADVSAVAAAACGAASSGCGAMPIAFDYPRYDSLPCSEFDGTHFTNYRVGSTFVLWAADNTRTANVAMCDQCHCDALNDDISPFFTGDTLVDNGAGAEMSWSAWLSECASEDPDPWCSDNSLIVGGEPMAAGNRGWLRLGLDKPYTKPEGATRSECNDMHSCNALACWLQYGYTGSLAIGDCLKGQPGVDSNALNAARARDDDIVSFVLYDPAGCASADPISANCSSSDGITEKTYKVQEIGCALLMNVFDGKKVEEDGGGTITLPPRMDSGVDCRNKNDPDCTCPTDDWGILVTKVCGTCPNTTCAGTTGGNQGEQQAGAVSLIAVPGS